MELVGQVLASLVEILLLKPLRWVVIALAKVVWRDLQGHEVTAPSEHSEWTIERLEALRSVGDDIADGCYALLQADVIAGKLDPAYDMVDEITRRAGEERHQNLSGDEAPFRRLEEAVTYVPDWVDFDVVERAKVWFTKVGVPGGSFVLTTASLVQSYGAAKGSTVLIETGRLRGDIMKRVYETGFFVHQVMSPSSLRPGLPGHLAILQVRMLHCAIREHLMARVKGWDKDDLGVPINQEDLAGTLSIFCVVVVEGLRKIGYEISDEEVREFHHLWRYIGYVLGVREDVLTKSYQEQVDQSHAIRLHQWNPVDHSRALVNSLFTQLHLRFNYFYLPTAFWAQLSRQLLGYENAEQLGFGQTDIFWESVIQLFCAAVRFQSFLHHRYAWTVAMTVTLGHQFWSLFVFLGLQGRSVSFKTQKYAAIAKMRGKKGKLPHGSDIAATCPFAIDSTA